MSERESVYPYLETFPVKAHPRRGSRGVRQYRRRGRWGQHVRFPDVDEDPYETESRTFSPDTTLRNPEELYHVTDADNLPGIMRRGILPAGRSPASVFDMKARSHGRIFLTPSESTASEIAGYIRNHQILHKKERPQLALVGVKTHGMKLYEPPPGANITREFYITRRISPNRLRVIDYDYT